MPLPMSVVPSGLHSGKKASCRVTVRQPGTKVKVVAEPAEGYRVAEYSVTTDRGKERLPFEGKSSSRHIEWKYEVEEGTAKLSILVEEIPAEEDPAEGATIEAPADEDPTEGGTLEAPAEEDPTEGGTLEAPAEEDPAEGATDDAPAEEDPAEGPLLHAVRRGRGRGGRRPRRHQADVRRGQLLLHDDAFRGREGRRGGLRRHAGVLPVLPGGGHDRDAQREGGRPPRGHVIV